jgi:hypothetical protein
MKAVTLIYAIFFGWMIATVPSPAQSSAAGTPLPDKQWEAPVMPGGTVVKTEDTAVFIDYDLPYEKVLAWYKDALRNYKDGKYRDWNDQMYIEDLGGAKWHSIGIFKGGGNKTTVKIVKDNMTWILSTLLIRFAGVFVVLCVLWILLNLSGAAMKRYFPSQGAKAKAN